MLTVPSFKKSLKVEQFQGNYRKEKLFIICCLEPTRTRFLARQTIFLIPNNTRGMKFKLPYFLIGLGFTVCALKGTFSMHTVDGSAERCQNHDRRCTQKKKLKLKKIDEWHDENHNTHTVHLLAIEKNFLEIDDKYTINSKDNIKRKQ